VTTDGPVSEPPALPQFDADQFKLTDGPECDIIMKGGITSGIVYPYAILELATKYRFRSLGGTSAGAIAAAFAAAAEYSRSVRGDAAGFIRLKAYCDALPEQLLSLFQPDEDLEDAAKLARQALKSGGRSALIWPLLIRGALFGLLTGTAVAILLWLWREDAVSTVLAFMLGFVVGTAVGSYFTAKARFVTPITRAVKTLPERMFGFCSGLSRPNSTQPGLTDWLHRAIQDIAFADPDAADPLTFGQLESGSRKTPPLELRMVTTNLSMARPHTLPRFGLRAGFRIDEWTQLFPQSVIAHLEKTCGPWKGMKQFPSEAELPVVVATRMSLSFPLLFKAVPLHAEDYEHFRIVKGLGGKPERRTRPLWMSDGGISSNFPIHMFDAPLPSRPTFAFSLETLDCAPSRVASRVLLPSDAMTGLGVQIGEIKSLAKFAGAVFYSAKDWQDQLLGGITGQRERIAKIFLSEGEGGLNLDMQPDVSRSLMSYGWTAGRLFTSGQFSFDEHRWRRLLAFYRNSTEWIDRAGVAWNSGYRLWYDSYAPHPLSYKMSGKTRNALRVALDVMLIEPPPEHRIGPKIVKNRFPRRVGRLRNAPEY
jgi:hypothetical protein